MRKKSPCKRTFSKKDIRSWSVPFFQNPWTLLGNSQMLEIEKTGKKELGGKQNPWRLNGLKCVGGCVCKISLLCLLYLQPGTAESWWRRNIRKISMLSCEKLIRFVTSCSWRTILECFKTMSWLNTKNILTFYQKNMRGDGVCFSSVFPDQQKVSRNPNSKYNGVLSAGSRESRQIRKWQQHTLCH